MLLAAAILFRNQIRFSICGALVILVVLVLQPDVVLSQQPLTWSVRQRIPGSHDDAETPYLIADQARTVHAFHAQLASDGEDEQRMAIFYSRWTLADGWSEPVDVLLTDGWGIIRAPTVHLDDKGVMHLVYYCCDDRDPKIYYSKAPAVYADRAPQWTEPILVGLDATAPGSLALSGDSQGNLYVVYSGRIQGGGTGVFSIHSLDDGASWSEPDLVYGVYDERFPYGLKSYLDSQGRLHAAWILNSPNGNGDSNYYARLEPDHITWSEPFLLAEKGQLDDRLTDQTIRRVYQPALVWHDDTLTVMYTACEPCEKRMRRSTDGGETWSSSEAFLPSRGDSGPVTFAVDSNNVLHALWGDRALGFSLWHRYTSSPPGPWSAPDPVIPLGEGALYADNPAMAFSSYDPRAIVSQGNILLVTWRLDPGTGGNGTWYSYTTLEVPELPLVAVSVSTPQANMISSGNPPPARLAYEATPRPQSTPPATRASITVVAPEPKTRNRPAARLYTGLLSAMALVSVIIANRLIRTHV